MRRIPVLITLCLLVPLAGCTDTDDSPGTPTTGTTGGTTTSGGSTGATGTADPLAASVDLHDDSFANGNKTGLAVGTHIKYANKGLHGHTVTVHWVGDALTTYKLDQTLQPGQSVNYTFAAPGTYHVFCRFHGTMTTGMATVVTVA
ncbi:MAG TPA: hypothetical protein VM286_08970 [Candidatus Thermoplasmatota archaeon]|nr:hypothetical protein [Candidatus Thermoplasmatota archaeon]